MLCIKTGFVATIAGYRLYGDAFILPIRSAVQWDNDPTGAKQYGDEPHDNTLDHLLLRVCGVRISTENWNDFGQINHIEAETYDYWFDQSAPISTLILAPYTWKWLGYNGQPATE